MTRKPRADPSHLQGTAISVRINQILPCLTCSQRRAAERSLEEVVSVFVAALHGEVPRQDGRPLRFLPIATPRSENSDDFSGRTLDGL